MKSICKFRKYKNEETLPPLKNHPLIAYFKIFIPVNKREPVQRLFEDAIEKFNEKGQQLLSHSTHYPDLTSATFSLRKWKEDLVPTMEPMLKRTNACFEDLNKSYCLKMVEKLKRSSCRKTFVSFTKIHKLINPPSLIQ